MLRVVVRLGAVRVVAKHRSLALLLLVLHFQALATDLEAVHALDRSVRRRRVVVAHEAYAAQRREREHSNDKKHSVYEDAPKPRLLPVSFSTMMRALMTFPNVAK